MRKRLLLIMAIVVLVTAGGVTGLVTAKGRGGSQTQAYCDTLEELMKPQSGVPDKESMTRLERLVTELTENAPPSLEASTKTYADGVRQFITALAKVDYKINDLPEESLRSLQAEPVAKASAEVMKSGTDLCRLPSAVPSDNGSAPAPASPPAESAPSGKPSKPTVAPSKAGGGASSPTPAASPTE